MYDAYIAEMRYRMNVWAADTGLMRDIRRSWWIHQA